jgi:hypothetical protein
MYVIYVLHPSYLGIGLVPHMHVGIYKEKIGVHDNRESPIKKRTCEKYETSRQQQSELEFDLFGLVSI